MTLTSVPGEPLLQFRLAYLRLLAKTWRDERFRKEIFSKPVPGGSMTEDIQDKLITNFGCTTKWPNLRVQLYASHDPAQAVRWSYKDAVGWIGPNDLFVITLPNCPDDSQKKYMAEALAAYYQNFPTVLGPALSTMSSPHSHGIGSPQPTAMGIPGGGPDSFLAFGSVILRAVILSWTNKEFFHELIHANDAVPSLAKWFGFSMPFNFFIKFEHNPSSDYNWSYNASSQTWGWNMGTPEAPVIWNKVVLNYPTCPDDEEIRPVALATYNNTGAAYPFTCN
ncbi:BMA_0021/BMA_0022 family TOMM bacteriocin [Curvibacter sp. CHRR-16]|uniref:BMA_0021/BMA_0022 family TOMM bacteriocin n=1 Tax=Curvibacter sp. CHRR-16 TaxID=2835872 RepID=UPI001BDA5B70|nr:BMA_0021/BMA_0022 family TOMM bacteriocin [Curvibacter sp. CHRR-16]MBT0569634.1 BMA_0021/BMA_0022 family TOMM bacteriocin [Curvibacter sp. CHRR-16]